MRLRSSLRRARAPFSLAVAGLLAVGSTTAVTPAIAANGSVLVKSGSDVTAPGANPVNHGDTLNWVVNYTDNGPTGPATITDPINNGQAYLPGSLRVPSGWTPSWSTDGTNFTTTDPGAATVAVRASNPVARPGGTSMSSPLLAPVQAASTATGGDGFTPILFHNPANGHTEIWNTYHHHEAPSPALVCSDLSTGQPCAGGPWPKPLNTAPGPLGSGATSDIGTMFTPQYVFDPARPGVLYYPAFTSAAVGVGCLDLNARANCGFFPLQNTGGSPSSVNDMAGIVTTGGNLYGVSTTGQVLCLVMASQAPCAGQPYAAIVPPNSDAPIPNRQYYRGQLTVAGGKVFASASPGSGPAMGCFDPATGTACTGWVTPKTIIADGNKWTWSEYTAYDTAGNAVGACTTVLNGQPFTGCYAVDGSVMPAPTVFASAPAGSFSLAVSAITAPNGDLQSYFPIFGAGIPGGTYCWDWIHAAPCAGFPQPATHGIGTSDYGYTYDTTTQCLYGLGDAGVLFSEDPASGVTPCQHSGAAVTLQPSAFYCDGGTGHVRGYQNARLDNINVADVNLAASSISVTDPNGTVIATPAFAPDGTVDLSGISATAHPGITVTTRLVLLNGNDFTGGNQPALVVDYQGDPPQVCFQTTVATVCTATMASNTATGTDGTGAITSNTVSLPVAPGPNCQPKVTVNKEICDNSNTHYCGPGGSGPWAKRSTPGLLGLLGTAFWRITVTNAGPVDAVGVTLNDPAEQSCASAAGTFDLPANSSKQFYCSTFLLLLPFTNKVTATFTPANSPAGTKPTTTASSSAVACSLLCIL